MIRRILAMTVLLGWAATAWCGEEVAICYNYACETIDTVEFSDSQLNRVRWLLIGAIDAAGERAAIAKAIGLFETFAGEQTPTSTDKGGNVADDPDVPGRMDCLDESANTTTYLRLMERLGWLRFHRVGEPLMRIQYLIYQHHAARLVETANGREFAVDSWFFDNGRPAVVFPLDEWQNGAWPDEK